MLIVGCGYIGTRVAQRLSALDRPVCGVIHSQAGEQRLATAGIRAIHCDLDHNGLPRGSSQAQQLLYCVPPPRSGRRDTRIQQLLNGLPDSGQPQRILYLSTTGVYGDCHGDWVDEQRPANPQADRAWRRWDAEQQLRAWRERTGGELVILRVAGIYGPGKLPLARLRRGEPMIAERDAPWSNRIHADDLVAACIAAMAQGRDGEVYNACDGSPGNMADYFNQVADLAGLPRPPVISLSQAAGSLSGGLLSYLEESRRLSNVKLLRDTGLTLRYPELASGLPACFDTDQA